MIILPAIDLKSGKCVRLSQGRADQETIYESDPARVARGFQEEGARMLHLVDLDGAFRGSTGNLDAIKAIRASIEIPIELGGGMRTLDDVKGMLELGIDSVIVGTMAVKSPEVLEEALARFGGDRIQLGVDAKNGMVAVHGWESETELEAGAFTLQWKERGIERVIFTDIARDGMMTGPNLKATREFAESCGLPVTASGGVSSPGDLVALRQLEPFGVDRAIVGKAIYEGTVILREVV